ncbi:MAG: hypothetical protein PHO37_11900 [Kiritimatiellae bacterium]|nr:hypothetical protein [Kiritimatiellia bacterium]
MGVHRIAADILKATQYIRRYAVDTQAFKSGQELMKRDSFKVFLGRLLR